VTKVGEAVLETLRICTLVILLAPLAGAIGAGALGRPVLRGRTHWVVIGGVGLAMVAAWTLLGTIVSHSGPEGHAAHIVLYQWIATGAEAAADGGGAWFNLEVLIDPLTAVMLATVTTISLLVVIYSRDYMRHGDHPERGYERFFAYLGLFVFSMCALVLGGNFLLLYLGWEAVGLCSFLLIGFYYSKPAAAAAAKKAFLVNRVGDFGFGLGILLIYLTFGTLQYEQVFALIERGVTGNGAVLETGRLTSIALLLLCGACGKSAQLPLHVWLPDAMEGPSPVSALIHAATMVTAGVYMVARCGAIFTNSPTAMAVVAVVGAATALFAATIAVVQTDMKRILAYSTISQLGYMFLGLGVYAAGSAVFHLYTHAFFKALLFLGAGSVMHAMGGIIDLREFGGLRKILPYTFITFMVGSLALAGVPFLSGFYSKDEIIHHAFTHHWLLGTIGLVTAALTAFYTFRMVFLAFFGPQRVPEGVHPHESGRWMLGPLFVLAIGAVFAGYLGVEWTGKGFHNFLSPVFVDTFAAHGGHGAHGAAETVMHGVTEAAGHASVVTTHSVETAGHAAEAATHSGFLAEYGLLFLSAFIALGAIYVAYLFFVKNLWIPTTFRVTFPGWVRFLSNKWYVDELYDYSLVRPARGAGRFCVGTDNYFIDGLVWLVTAIPRGIGAAFRLLQSGALQGYALSMITGVAILVIFVLAW
jgi:NADH-quinone oxidoreductase subunit L